MQFYLQPDTLKEMHIDYFDNWASVFGNTVSALELKPTGQGFRMKTRFASFHNLPELCNLFSEVFDIKRTAELNLALPEIVGGKPTIIVCEKSPEQEEQTMMGMERAQAVENRLVRPEEDNMLAICTYMTKVALDARINDPEADDFEGSKVNQCAKEILSIANKHPGTAQVVFCDSNTPQGEGFSVYRALRDVLVSSGQFTDTEIAFIHDYDSDAKRLHLFEDVNEAKVKVVIGSTSKLGTGVNMQARLIAAHHLDAPYRPADLEQRNGRLVRQGNLNPYVYINYYSTKGTFDSYRWQLLEKKQQFIAQIMSGKPASRSCEDIDESALTYAEMKAATTENPMIAEKLTIDNEASRLLLLQTDWIDSQNKLKKDVAEDYPTQIANVSRKLDFCKADIQLLNENENANILINNIEYEDRSSAGEAIFTQLKRYMTMPEFKDYVPLTIGKYKGFELQLRNTTGFEADMILKHKLSYHTPIGSSAVGAVIRLDNLAERIPNYEKEYQQELNNLQAQLEIAKKELGKPFELADELRGVLLKQAELNALLEFGEAEEEFMEGGDDEFEMG